MELLDRLSWVDLAIIIALGVGLFIGFAQGAIRYGLNALAVLVAFVLAAQLKGPIVDLLGFWTAFTLAGRELFAFVLLFFGLVIAAWFAIRALVQRTRLPVPRVLDELVGALFGVAWVALIITFHLVAYESYFVSAETAGWVGAYYEELNDSSLVELLRLAIIPTAGFLVRPFVPSDIAQLLDR